MTGVRAGAGIAIGAGLGLVLGLLILDAWWYGVLIGAVAGLLVGAIVEMLSRGPDPAGDAATPRRERPTDRPRFQR